MCDEFFVTDIIFIFLGLLKGKLHNTNFYIATISALLAACKLSAQIKKRKNILR